MLRSLILTGCALTLSFFPGLNAQSSEGISVSTEIPSTTTRDFNSETSSVPLATPTAGGQPCGRIASIINAGGAISNLSVPAEVAYECLTSVPVRQDAALGTIDALVKMVQFQSNLAYLKDPPEGYDNPPVDILGGLAEIRNKVSSNEFSNQFDFEAEIAGLLNSARDGHFGFDGPTYVGAVRWRRDAATVLISTSLDGGPPKIYHLADLNSTSSPSPVTQINGEDVVEFLLNEADRLTYHDPDTRWNALFYRQSAQSFGFFISPPWYPGPDTTISFENGTVQTYPNQAILRQPEYWSEIFDGESFYSTFVNLGVSWFKNRKARRDTTLKRPPRIPKRLQEIHQNPDDDGNADVPVGYPEPYLTGPSDTTLNAYFLDHPNPSIGNIGVLSLQTFDTDTDEGAAQFQALVQQFLAEAQNRGIDKIVIDLSSNAGGRVFLGYDTFLQFFPDIVPFGGTRYRAHEAADLMGTEISRVSLDESGTLYTSPFNYHSFLSSTLEPFTSWPDMYGNGDTSTQVLRYNLTDPLVTLSTRFGDGITMTGTLTRSNFTTPPFPPENLIVLTDGLCGSTCHLFIDFMTVQAGVRTIALGGRPAYGPMQPVGGTKGANVLTADYLTSFAEYVISGFASGSEQTKEWAGILPSPFPIQTFETTVNFLDSVREGEDVVVPSQFTNETANCRLWYSADMVQDVTEVWRVVADAAWGGPDGGMDEARCVPGSFKRETLLEEPPQTVQGGGDASGAEEGASNGPGGTSGSENRNSAGPLDVRWTTLLLAVVLGAATSTFIFAS